MSSIKSDDENLIRKCASLLLKVPMLTLPQAMHAPQFLDAQSKNPAMQMQVRRYIAKHHSTSPKAVYTSLPTNTMSTLSSQPPASAVSVIALTPTPTNIATSPPTSNIVFPKPTLDAIQLTAEGKAKDVNNKKLDSAHYSAALKTATKMYYEELQKPKGEIRLSAEEVEKIIKARFDEIGPSARTITRYVNDYSLVGSSPVKRGSPGTLPDWAFE